MTDFTGPPARHARLRKALSILAGGPQVLAFLPAVTLGAYWIGGEPYLLLTAVLVPAAFAAGGLFTRSLDRGDAPTLHRDGLPGRSSAVAHADALLAGGDGISPSFTVLAVGIDDAREVEERVGPAAFRDLAARIGDRIASAVRSTDFVAQTPPASFALILSSQRSGDLETLLQLCSRIQDAVAEPLALGGARVYLSASVGFARPGQTPVPSGEALLSAAELAMSEAAAHGPGSLRSYAGTSAPARPAGGLEAEIAEAVASGQIVPWFQPQVAADTGALTGAEALARWMHPTRGLLPPSEFLREAAAAGLSERLGAAMLHGALAALRSFDEKGLEVPRISVNFAAAELRNPGIVDRVRWELDRFGLAPGRLIVEVLETVIEDVGDDVVTRSLAGLSALGCGIDLDDFGTGHAAIGSIRRFSIQRVKIDRSFVRRIDTDTDQQALVSAMLLMSDRLGLDTLAEGVETAAEHAALVRLGCRHVQGFAIARPMPEAAFLNWLAARPPGPSLVSPAQGLTGTGETAGAPGKTA
jgi:EAL domain-containing protein (putative c-di-GMP-specific phosphodiesterase class I)/GGDEF domain-containing protein